jgi:hypothetical protein
LESFSQRSAGQESIALLQQIRRTLVSIASHFSKDWNRMVPGVPHDQWTLASLPYESGERDQSAAQ